MTVLSNFTHFTHFWARIIEQPFDYISYESIDRFFTQHRIGKTQLEVTTARLIKNMLSFSAEDAIVGISSDIVGLRFNIYTLIEAVLVVCERTIFKELD